MPEADVNLNVGLNLLNKDLDNLRKSIEQKLSGLRLDINGDVSAGGRAGLIQKAVGGGLVSGTATENAKVASSAIKALDSEIATLTKSQQKQQDVVRSNQDRVNELNVRLKELTNNGKETSAAFRSLNDQLARASTKLEESRRKSSDTSDILGSLQKARKELDDFAERVRLNQPSINAARSFQGFVQNRTGTFGAVGAPTNTPIRPLTQAIEDARRSGTEFGKKLVSGEASVEEVQRKIQSIVSNFALQNNEEAAVRRAFDASFGRSITRAQNQAASQQERDTKALARAESLRIRAVEREVLQIQALNDRLKSAQENVIKAQNERAAKIRIAASQEAAKGTNSGPNTIATAAASISPNGQGTASALNRLNAEEQAQLTKILLAEGDSAKFANKELFGLSGALANTNDFAQRLASNLKLGDQAAFEFGVSAANAAKRLAAWAIPSLFVFNTIGSLKNAVDQIVELDTQTRRLVFFQEGNDNPFVAFAKAAEVVPTLNEQISSSFNAIIGEAQRTGLSINQITDAVLSVSRVGEKVFEVQKNFDGLHESVKLVASDFLQAVESAVRMEGGILSADKATTILKAALEQNNLTSKDAIQISALLSFAANKSSTDFEGLGTVVNRVSASFSNLQNASPAEIINFVSAAITRLGTNPSRAATALRQLSTLFVKFGKDIKAAIGVDVVNDQGQLSSINNLLDAFEKIRALKGTAGGFSLAKFFAEAKDIPDFFNLVEGVDKLREALKEVSGEEGVAFTRKAVETQLRANEAAAQGFESTLQRLNTTLVEFAKAINLPELFASFESGITNLLGTAGNLAKSFNEIPPAFKNVLASLSTLAFLPILKSVGTVTAGFFAGAFGGQIENIRNQIAEVALSSTAQFRGGEIVNRAQKESLLTEEQALQFKVESNAILEKELALNSEIALAKSRIVQLERSSLDNTVALDRESSRLANLESRRIANLEAEVQLRKDIVTQTRSEEAAQSFAGARKATLIQTGLIAGGLIVGGLASSFSSKKTGDLIQSAITGAFTGGTFGAALGEALFPPGGGLVGGLIGGAGGALTAIFSTHLDQQKEINNEKEREATIDKAEASQRRELIAQGQARVQSAFNLSVIQKELLKAQNEQGIAQFDFIQAQRRGTGEAEAEQRVREATTKVIQLQKQLQIDEVAIVNERIAAEQNLIEIKQRSSRLTQAISLVENQEVEQFKLLHRSKPFIREIEFSFDKKKLQAEAAAIQEQIDSITLNVTNLRVRQGGGENLAQEIRSQEVSLKRLEEERSTLRLKALEIEQAARKEELEGAKEDQKQRLSDFESAAREVVSAMSTIVGQERDLVNLLASKGQIQLNTANIQLELEKGFQAFDNSLQRQIQNANLAVNNVGRELGLVESNFADQLKSIDFNNVAPVSIKELNDASDALRTALASTAGKTSEELTPLQRQQVVAARAAVEADKARLQVNQQIIAIELSRLQALEKNARDEINVRKNLIDVNKQLLAAEAKRGENLLHNPEEFLNQLFKVQTAKQFVQGAGVNNAQDALNKFTNIIRLNAGKPGELSALNEIEAGLKAAVEQGFQLVQGVAPEELLNIFQAAIVGAAGSNRGGQANQVINDNTKKLDELNNQLIDISNREQAQIGNQILLNNAVSKLNQVEIDFAKDNRDNFKVREELARDTIKATERGFEAVGIKIALLRDGVNTLLGSDLFRNQLGILNGSVTSILNLLEKQTVAQAQGPTTQERPISLNNLRGLLEFQFRNAGIGQSTANDTINRLLGKVSGSLFPSDFQTLVELMANNSRALPDVGKIRPALENMVKFLEQTAAQGQFIPVRNSHAELSSLTEANLSPGTNKSLSDVIIRSGLETELDKLGQLIVDAKEDPSRKFLVQEQEARIQRAIDSIAENFNLDALTHRMDGLITAIESQNQRNPIPTITNEDKLPPGGAKNKLSNQLVNQDFVSAIQTAATNGVTEGFKSAAQNLNQVISNGINVNVPDVQIRVHAEILKKLDASQELLDVLNDITGGNREETQRLFDIIKELVQKENERGSNLSLNAIDVSNDNSTGTVTGVGP